MTNYKTGWPQQIQVVLYLDTPTATNADAFEKVVGTAYQVPSGLKFYATHAFFVAVSTATAYMKIFQGDLENGIDVEKQKIQTEGALTSLVPINYIFESDKFVTGDPAVASEFTEFQLHGYEAP